MQSLWMVVAAMFFALYAVCIKFASIEGIGSFEVLFYRSIFGLIIFYTMMRIQHITVHTAHPVDHRCDGRDLFHFTSQCRFGNDAELHLSFVYRLFYDWHHDVAAQRN